MLIKPLQNIKKISKIQVKYFLKNNVFRYTVFTFEIINCCFDLNSLSPIHFVKIPTFKFLGNEFLVKMYKLEQNYTFKIDTISKIIYI